MKRFFSTISAALLVTVSALAQNLNPVVEVTNTYEGRLSDIHKPDQLLNIPDSVTRFKLDFDYSVFEKPYKGAYEFSPYLIAMKPEAAPDESARFYLKAGAGYTLRPELTFIWTPRLKNGFSANVHADANSFIGKYRYIGPEQGEDAIMLKYNGTTVKGNYLRGGIGADLGYAWRTGTASLSLDYVKQMENFPFSRSYDGFVFNPSVRSTDPEASLYYEASLKYRYGHDRDPHFGDRDGNASTFDSRMSDEHYYDFQAKVGPVLDQSKKILLGVSAVTDRINAPKWNYWSTGSYEGNDSPISGGHVSLVPEYVYSGERLEWSAGVRISFLFSGVDSKDAIGPVSFSHRGQLIYPEAHISYRILEETLTAYASATGGPRLNTYGSILEKNRYFSPGTYSGMAPVFPFDHSIERFNLKAGVKGNLKKRLQWDLSGGYALWDHALSDGFLAFVVNPQINAQQNEYSFMGRYVYSDMKVAYADLKFLFDSQHIDVDGTLSFKHATGLEDLAFAPAKFSGDIRASYDWKGRIKAGITGNFATSRDGHYSYSGTGGTTVIQAVRIPGYVDLGLFGEYTFNRRWAVWAKAGNLLNQTIQRVPFYAEDGAYFTAGICLTIR